MGRKSNKKKNQQEQDEGPSSSHPQGDQQPPSAPPPSPSAPSSPISDDNDLKALLEAEYGVTPEQYNSLLPYIPSAEAQSGANEEPLITALRALALASQAEAARRRVPAVPTAEIHNQQLEKSQSEEAVSIDHQELGSSSSKKKQQQQGQEQEEELSESQPQGDQQPAPSLPFASPPTAPSASPDAPMDDDTLKFYLETNYGLKPEEWDALFPYIPLANAIPSVSVPASAAPIVAALKALALSSMAEAAARRRGEMLLLPVAAPTAPYTIDPQDPVGNGRNKRQNQQEEVAPPPAPSAPPDANIDVTQEQNMDNLFTNILPAGYPVVSAAEAKKAAAMVQAAKAALEAVIAEVLARRGTQQSIGRHKKSNKKQQPVEQLPQRQEPDTSPSSSCSSSSGPPLESLPPEFRSYAQQWMLLPSSSYLDLSCGLAFLPNAFSGRVFFEVRRENQSGEQSSSSVPSAPHESGGRPADLVALLETYVRSGGPIYLTTRQYITLFPEIAALNEIMTTRAATETEMLAGAQAAADAAYAALAEAEAAIRGPPLLPGVRVLFAALYQEGSWPSGPLYFNPIMQRTTTMDLPQPCAAPAPAPAPAPGDAGHEDHDGHNDDEEAGQGSASAAGNSGGGASGDAQ